MRYALFLVCGLFGFNINAQESSAPVKDVYQLKLDIANIENDRVQVSIQPPQAAPDSAIYNMPKIVPGTYSVSDFGRFVEGMTALNAEGDTIETIRLDTNRWYFPTMPHTISYFVNDTYDAPRGGGIFEPGGTNIEAGKNVVLNPFGFAGYFSGLKKNPYNVEVLRPADFYGETTLSRGESEDNTDFFYAEDYFKLHDSPILYAKPDTASMMVGDTKIAVAVYAPKGTINSGEILKIVENLFPAASDYLGGDLPVDKYAILIYFTDGMTASGGMGALEHNTSTVFVLPEVPLSALEQTIKDVTAHEFFHIVTPLNIHSEQINDYDFMNPQMSAHLWLYEGCTEYAAQHVQVKQGLMPFEEFLDVMKGKMIAASRYDTGVAFTELSKKALDEHESQYGNVYQQGALIGMALDLKLRSLSDGNYGIQKLMQDLSKKYGPDKPFEDDKLFEIIGQVSGYPEVEQFLEKYVGEANPLPYQDLFENVGILYRDSLVEEVVSAGSVSLGYNPGTERMVVVKNDDLDAFGQDLGFEPRDEIISWNGASVNKDNIQDVIGEYKKNVQPGDKVTVMVARRQEDGSYKNKKLKAKAISTESVRRNVLELMDNPSPEQLKIRRAWVNA